MIQRFQGSTRLWAILAALAVVFLGCNIRADLVINEDETGTFVYSIAMENKYVEAFSQGGKDPLAQMEEKAKDSEFPVKTKRFKTKDSQGVEVSYTFESLDDLAEKMAAGEDKEGALLTKVEVTNEDAGWTFNAVGGGDSASEGLPLEEDELAELMDIKLSVTLPGPDPEGNADEIEELDDSVRFTWNIPPGKGNLKLEGSTHYPVADDGTVLRPSIDGTTPTGDKGTPWVPIAIAVVVAAGLAAFGLMWRRRNTPEPS